MPVPTSRETPAIGAPPTPPLINPSLPLSPGLLTPRLVIGFKPSWEQAFFQAILFSGLSIWRIWPALASSSSALTPIFGATISSSAFKAAVAATREEADTPPTVVLPPEPPEEGYSLF